MGQYNLAKFNLLRFVYITLLTYIVTGEANKSMLKIGDTYRAAAGISGHTSGLVNLFQLSKFFKKLARSPIGGISSLTRLLSSIDSVDIVILFTETS